MKSIYIECKMGCAGDMLLAGLVGVMDRPEEFMYQLNKIGLVDTKVTLERVKRCNILGNQIHMQVRGIEEEVIEVKKPVFTTNHTQLLGCDIRSKVIEKKQVEKIKQKHEHHHGHEEAHEHVNLSSVIKLIQSLKVSNQVKGNAIEVYKLLADAEASVHGCTMEQIHFHEVGTLDAIGDIVGVCMALENLGNPKVLASPIHVGNGTVLCAHGVLPVPAPATEKLLQGIPYYSGEITGELCTPTGAALLRHFVSGFIPMPIMDVKKTGYGMGKKEFEQVNCIRVFLSETEARVQEQIVRLTCNVDDMTGEELGYAMECLMEEGALDAYVIPIQMKKGRPGFIVVCLCKKDQEKQFVKLIYGCTTTLGICKELVERSTLSREICEENTPYGVVRIKKSKGFGVEKTKIEYEDIRRLAKEQGKSFLQMKCDLQEILTNENKEESGNEK